MKGIFFSIRRLKRSDMCTVHGHDCKAHIFVRIITALVYTEFVFCDSAFEEFMAGLNKEAKKIERG